MDDLWTSHGPGRVIKTMSVVSHIYLEKKIVWTGRVVYPEARHKRIGEQDVGAICFLLAVIMKSA